MQPQLPYIMYSNMLHEGMCLVRIALCLGMTMLPGHR